MTNRELRRRNRSPLLTKLFFDGPLSRQELARSTGLSQAAVSNVVGRADRRRPGRGGRLGRVRRRPARACCCGSRRGYALRGRRRRRRDPRPGRAVRPRDDRAGHASSTRSTRGGPSRDLVVGHVAAGLAAVPAQAGRAPRPTCSASASASPASSSRARRARRARARPSAGTRVPLERCCAGRHRRAAAHRQRRQDARPGRDVVRRRPRRPARRDRPDRLGRRRRGGHRRRHLPGRRPAARASGATPRSCTAAARCRCGARGCLEAYVGAEAHPRPLPARRGGGDGAGRRRGVAASPRCSPPPTPATHGRGRGARRDRRLPRRRHRQPDQPVQPGADRARRLGRPGPRRHGCCRPIRAAAGGARAAPAVRSRRRSSCASSASDAVALGAATLPIARFLTRGRRPPLSRQRPEPATANYTKPEPAGSITQLSIDDLDAVAISPHHSSRALSSARRALAARLHGVTGSSPSHRAAPPQRPYDRRCHDISCYIRTPASRRAVRHLLVGLTVALVAALTAAGRRPRPPGRRPPCCPRAGRPPRRRPRAPARRRPPPSTATPAPAGPARSATRSGSRSTSARPPRSARSCCSWEAAYARAFQIQTSADGTTWTTVYTTTTGTGGTQTLTVTGTGRYVRMYGTARATGYGYSLWEFQVYGTIGGSPARLRHRPTRRRAGPPPRRRIENAGTPATAAVDGNAGTRWSSAVQRPAVAPGRPRHHRRRSARSCCSGRRAYATAFQIQTSRRRHHVDHDLLDDHRHRRHADADRHRHRPLRADERHRPRPPATATRSGSSGLHRQRPDRADRHPPTRHRRTRSSRPTRATRTSGRTSTSSTRRTPTATIQSRLNTDLHRSRRPTSSAPQRYALLFKPGTYTADVNLGFYTQVAGLGLLARRREHQRRTCASRRSGSAATPPRTSGARRENLSRRPCRPATRPVGRLAGGAVPPDARPAATSTWHRRLRLGQRRLHRRHAGSTARSAPARSSSGTPATAQFGSWSRPVWNMVFSGRARARRRTSFPNPPYTVDRHHPGQSGRSRSCTSTAPATYQVFVPALRTNSHRHHAGRQARRPARRISLGQFFVVQAGRHRRDHQRGARRRARTCCSRPGVYHLNQTINVTRAEHRRPGPRPAPRSSRTTASTAHDGRRRRRRQDRRHPVRRRHDQLAGADGGRPGRLVRRPRRATRPRCTTCSSASAAPAVGKATTSLRGQQRQRDRRPHLGSGAPTTAPASAGPSTPPTPA